MSAIDPSAPRALLHRLLIPIEVTSSELHRLVRSLEAEAMAAIADGRTDYADFLLRKLNEFQLTDFILQVNEDVLGDYRYRVHRSYDDPRPKVRLFWGVNLPRPMSRMAKPRKWLFWDTFSGRSNSMPVATCWEKRLSWITSSTPSLV